MAISSNGEPVPCGGCPGGFFCNVMDEHNCVHIWMTETFDAKLYGCEFADRDGMRSTPTIVEHRLDGEIIIPSPQTLADAKLFDKQRVTDPAMAVLLKRAGEFCVRRVKQCPGPRKNYASSPPVDICPAGLGQSSVQLFILQLNRERRERDNPESNL